MPASGLKCNRQVVCFAKDTCVHRGIIPVRDGFLENQGEALQVVSDVYEVQRKK